MSPSRVCGGEIWLCAGTWTQASHLKIRQNIYCLGPAAPRRVCTWDLKLFCEPQEDGHCYSVVLANPVYMVALGVPGGLQGAGRKGSALSPFGLPLGAAGQMAQTSSFVHEGSGF